MTDLMARVPWHSRREIADEAEALLCRYTAFAGKVISPPIPVEELVEHYLGITLEYDDLETRLGIPDVLGATWVEKKLMVIHEPLLEGAEGRLVFTCAHEVGHWIMHRELAQKEFKRTGNEAIVCRDGSVKLRGEWQADYFASCLLMPEEAVQEAFARVFGGKPLVMYNARSCYGRGAPLLDPALDTAPEIAEAVKQAGGFTNCSREAMRYRLEDLDLLINLTGK